MDPNASAGARFRAAVAAEQPLQVVGAITAYAGLMARRVGYRALYLSGGGVAANSLGVPDLQAGKPAPGGAPTVAEMGPYRPGPESTVAPLVRFDPGCVGKSFLKSLKGKNDTYYLYRLRDRQGDRVEMTDHKLDVATFQGEIEFLGRFDGECDAVAAYRREQARLVPPAPTPGPPASPSPSPPTAQR